MPKKLFKKGPDDRRGKGGYRPGSGRKTDEFKERCRQLASELLLPFAEKVLKGEEVDVKVSEGSVLKCEASVDSKVFIGFKLAEWAHGKPHQGVEVSGPGGDPLVLQVPLRDQGQAGRVK